MTEITVKVDAETGAATIEMRGASVVEPRFRLRDAASERFLTRRGWSKTPSFLPGEAVTAADFTALALDADLARRINPAMSLVLEQPTSNIFASLAWPGQAEAEAQDEDKDKEEAGQESDIDHGEADDEPAAADTADQPAADRSELESKAEAPESAASEAAVEDTAAKSTDDAVAAGEPATIAASPNDVPGPSAAEPDDGDSWVAAATRDVAADLAGDKADAGGPVSQEPESLEPAIREEAIASDRSDGPAATKDRTWSRTTAAEDDDDDEEDGWPWGKLVAAAVAFTLLGSILTYLWQNSAYENELRTAMRAVEAQRDEIKGDLEKRLAEAEARAGAESSAAVTAAESSVATLTEKAETLTRDRDDAREALAQQQSKAKSLEERLATAQGEIDSLRQAAEADATEQSAVFNDRITALGKDLESARSQLDASRDELATRDRALAESADALKKARDETAKLRQASEENKAAANEELEGRIRSLSEQLDKTAQDLATRDAALRDVQAKLSVANVQIEALKQVAGKATAADLEKSTMAAQVAELTSQVENSSQQLAAKDAELRKAKTSLDAANALLAKNNADAEQEKTKPAAEDAAATDAATEQLKQERDLYAKELSAMTETLNSLKAERDRLAAASGSDAGVATANAAAEGRAVWGATAIDQTGAIYSLQNQITEAAASENVLALCKGKSNGSCEALRTYSNTCFSLARIEGEGPQNDNFGFSMDRDWKKAEAGAVRQCEELGADCTVRFTVCSPDGLSKPADQ